MQFTSDDMPLNEYDITKICTRDAMEPEEISKRCVFVLVTWPRRLPEEWPEACGSLTVVFAGIMHGFDTGPITNPTIWLVESRTQVNQFAYRGRISD